MRALLCAALLAALALAGCTPQSSANQAEPPPARRQAALAAFDPKGLDAGLQLPELSAYWRGSEARNGNALPYRLDVAAAQVVIRIGKDGGFSVKEGEHLREATLRSVAASVQSAADGHWNEGLRASYAEVILLADVAAPIKPLLELCEKLTNARVANLYLTTMDPAGRCCRLLPLHVDLTQAGEKVYSLPKSLLPQIARLRLVGSGAERAAAWQKLDRSVKASAKGEKWAEALRGQPAVRDSGIKRLQIDLTPAQTVADLREAIEGLAPLGYSALELFVPALHRGQGDTGEQPDAVLPEFSDTPGLGKRVSLPTLIDFWKAGRHSGNLPPASLGAGQGEPFFVSIDAQGRWACRRGAGEWQDNLSDAGLLKQLREAAEDGFDLDANVSPLQTVAGIDRRADVIHLLALEEMLKQARCHRLFLLVLDAVGPVPRLLDVSLPLGEGVLGQVARVALKREQDALTATFEFESKNLQAQGEAWPTELSRLAAAAEHKADLVLVSASKVSMAELFAALDALTPLGVGAIRVVP